MPKTTYLSEHPPRLALVLVQYGTRPAGWLAIGYPAYVQVPARAGFSTNRLGDGRCSLNISGVDQVWTPQLFYTYSDPITITTPIVSALKNYYV